MPKQQVAISRPKQEDHVSPSQGWKNEVMENKSTMVNRSKAHSYCSQLQSINQSRVNQSTATYRLISCLEEGVFKTNPSMTSTGLNGDASLFTNAHCDIV